MVRPIGTCLRPSFLPQRPVEHLDIIVPPGRTEPRDRRAGASAVKRVAAVSAFGEQRPTTAAETLDALDDRIGHAGHDRPPVWRMTLAVPVRIPYRVGDYSHHAGRQTSGRNRRISIDLTDISYAHPSYAHPLALRPIPQPVVAARHRSPLFTCRHAIQRGAYAAIAPARPGSVQLPRRVATVPMAAWRPAEGLGRAAAA
jgi:hypothetical protein